jgi:hypothetical protein
MKPLKKVLTVWLVLCPSDFYFFKFFWIFRISGGYSAILPGYRRISEGANRLLKQAHKEQKRIHTAKGLREEAEKTRRIENSKNKIKKKALNKEWKKQKTKKQEVE